MFRPPGQDVIWLFCMRAPMHYRDSENADLVAAYTADGGYSWIHVELALGYQGSLIIVAGIETVERDGVTYYPVTGILCGMTRPVIGGSLCWRAPACSTGN